VVVLYEGSDRAEDDAVAAGPRRHPVVGQERAFGLSFHHCRRRHHDEQRHADARRRKRERGLNHGGIIGAGAELYPPIPGFRYAPVMMAAWHGALLLSRAAASSRRRRLTSNRSPDPRPT